MRFTEGEARLVNILFRHCCVMGDVPNLFFSSSFLPALGWIRCRSLSFYNLVFLSFNVPDCFLLFILLLLAVLGLCCCAVFSLVDGGRGYSLVAVRGLLTTVAALVAEHGL